MSDCTPCILCGETDSVLEHEVTDALATQQRFGIHRCASCGVRYTAPRPNEGEIGRYYESDDYAPHGKDSRSASSLAYRSARWLNLRWKRRIVAGITEPARMLDVGCGTGAFLRTMEGVGWTVAGVEPDADARTHAQARCRNPTRIYGDLDDVPVESRYELITLWHVLEHLHSPSSCLVRARQMLVDGGHVLIAVPNSDSRDATLYGPSWAPWDAPRHLTHFNAPTLESEVRDAGLDIVRSRGIPQDAVYASLMSEKRAETGRMTRGVWRAFCALISALWHPHLGSSILMVARKG